MRSWQEKNGMEMHSLHNERKSVIAERLIRTLNNKIYKCMTSISKNVYLDKLDDIVNKYNNLYHSTIKMKPVDVNSSTYIDSSKEMNNKDPKFKIDDTVRTSNTRVFLQKVKLQIGLKKILFKKVKNMEIGKYLASIMNKIIFDEIVDVKETNFNEKKY